MVRKFDGHWRYIFHLASPDDGRVEPEGQLWGDTQDYDAQMELLAKGFQGIQLEKDAGGERIRFARVNVSAVEPT